MRDDIPTLLRDAATDPSYAPDFDALATRGRRQHLAARLGSTTLVVLALVAGGVALWPDGQPSPAPIIGDQPATEDGHVAASPSSTNTPTPDESRVAGTLQPRTNGPSAWKIALDPGHLDDVDVAYLQLHDDSLVTCQDGTALEQDDLRAGQSVTVEYTFSRLSNPPVLDASTLTVACDD